jgi:hypothetical protein
LRQNGPNISAWHQSAEVQESLSPIVGIPMIFACFVADQADIEDLFWELSGLPVVESDETQGFVDSPADCVTQG